MAKRKLEIYQELGTKIRAHCLRMTHRGRSGHLGSMLSMADLLAVLYTTVLGVDPEDPEWPERDRFILSKGHGGAAVYAVLAEEGFFPKQWLETYYLDDGKLSGHIRTIWTTASSPVTSAITYRGWSSPRAPWGTAFPWPSAWRSRPGMTARSIGSSA